MEKILLCYTQYSQEMMKICVMYTRNDEKTFLKYVI